MYPSTTYKILAQTRTGTTTTNGPSVNFTTGALPANIPFPTYTTSCAGCVPAGPNTDIAARVSSPIRSSMPPPFTRSWRLT